LIRARALWGVILFTLACFAREQSFVFLPIAAYTYWLFSPDRSIRGLLSVITAPIVLYGSYYAFSWQSPEADRFSLIIFNFDNPLRTSDTIFSLFISFGLLWVTTLIGLSCKRTSPSSRLLFWGAVTTLPMTLIITLFLACARETRLLFPPFLFVIPLSLIVLRTIYCHITTVVNRHSILTGLLVFAMLMSLGIILGNLTFPAFEYRRCPNFQRLWAGIHFGLILSLGAYWIRWRKSGFLADSSAYRGSSEL
jgi:hypothetical protein